MSERALLYVIAIGEAAVILVILLRLLNAPAYVPRVYANDGAHDAPHLDLHVVWKVTRPADSPDLTSIDGMYLQSVEVKCVEDGREMGKR